MDARLERASALLTGASESPAERRPLDLAALAARAHAAGDGEAAAALLCEAAGWFRRHPLRAESDPDAALDGAVALLLAGFRDRGLAALRARLTASAPDSTAALLSALGRLEEGDADLAFAEFDRLLPGFFSHPEVNLLMGALDLARGAYESALDYAARAAAAEGYAREAALLAALARTLAGDFEAALAAAAGCRAARPADREAAYLEAWLLVRLDRLAEARRLLEAHPDRDGRLEGALGWLEFVTGDFPAARARLERAGPGPGALHRRVLGDLCALLGERDTAARLYRERLAARPHDATTRANLAHVLLLEGRPDEAGEALAPLFADGAPPPDERAHALRYKVETVKKLRR